MQVDIYNQKNEKVGVMELPDRLFTIKWNSVLVHQTLMAQLANRRIPWAHAKGRGEVRGGGKKPWRQKGTGRARHGSIRSPLWKGGGVTFGPTKERHFAKKINKKMNRLAIFSVLSKKLKDGELKIVDSLKAENVKTKNLAAIIKNIFGIKDRILLIASAENKIVSRLAANLKKVNAIGPQSLNVYDLLNCKNIILEQAAIGEIDKHYK